VVPEQFSETKVVAGSLLSLISAVASPNTFVWSRWMDAGLSLADHATLDTHARIERWTLDEVVLPGKLVNQIFHWLYREDRFCHGILTVLDRTVGPASIEIPVLAIVNVADEIAPLTSVAPFIDKMLVKDTRIIEHPGEIGVGLPHLGVLVGRTAYARVGRKSLLGSRRAVESNIVFTSQIRAAIAARKAIGDPRRWCGEPIQPMTLGNMRENGVRGLFCDLPRLRPSHCGRRRRLAG
jgi:hypothetical protein